MPTNTVYDSGTQSPQIADDSTALNKDDLLNAENADANDSPETSFFNTSDSGSRLSKAKTKLGKLAKNKLVVGGVVGGSGFLITAIVVLILLAGSLKIPNLATHIVGYEFARLSRQMAENTKRVATEEIGVAAASDSAWSRITDKYSVVRDKTYGPMIDKVNSYRPGKVYQKLQTNKQLDFKYEPRRVILNGNIKVGSKLTALVVDGKEIPVNSSKWKTLVHPLQSFGDSVELSRSLNNSLVEALPSTNFVVRGFVARNYAKSAGLRYQWYNPKIYAGKTEAQAKVAIEQESASRISGEEPPVGSVVDKVNEASKEAEKIKSECLAKDACAQKLVNSGGVSAEAEAAIAKTFKSTLADEVVGALSPLGVLVPACIIYDGSMDSVSTSQVIDRKSTADMRAFMAVSSAADQQKYGAVNGEGVGAMNWKVGQIEKSNAEIRTSGKVVDTSHDDQPQAASGGEYTSIADSLPGPLATFIKTFAQPACPLLSSFEFNVGAGLLSIAAAVFSGGTSEAATGAASVGLKTIIADYTKHLVESLLVKKTYVQGAKVAGKTAANGAAIVGLTVLAQNIVHNKTAATDIALSTETDFTNASDTGANLYANQISRQHYGRPLSCSEIEELRSADTSYQTAMAGNKSSFDRYLALSNPDSLITHVGSSLSGQINLGIANRVMTTAANIFNPSNAIVNFTGLFRPQLAHALSGGCVDKQDYGVVQWGTAPDEENLMNNDASYKPLENQRLLDSRDFCKRWSSVRGCLERGLYVDQPFLSQYNACFGYDASGNVDNTATMGWLLARNSGSGLNPVLKRDNSGNIVNSGPNIYVAHHDDVYPKEVITTIDSITVKTDQAFCSPGDIGVHNDAPILGPGNGTLGDLVFRYRLEKNNELTLDQLLSVQNAGETPSVQ